MLRFSWSEVHVKEASSCPKAEARARLADRISSDSLKLHSGMRAASGETPPEGLPVAKPSNPNMRPAWPLNCSAGGVGDKRRFHCHSQGGDVPFQEHDGSPGRA